MELTEEQLSIEIQRYESVLAGPFDGGCLDHGRSVTEFTDDAKYRTCGTQARLGSIARRCDNLSS
jgi:hypothetical protein